MKLTFLGADHEVTGSCHLLQACGKNIYIDFGMKQGNSPYERAESPVSASNIDYVFLTHAHIDHSGMLPKLVKDGFKGQILATDATVDLCKIMLLDSAHIQQMETEWKNRKNIRAGRPIEEPVYSINDANATLELLRGFEYNKIINVTDGIQIRFTDVGHMLGSASIEVWIDEEGVSKKIVFSGDVGNINQPLIRDPDTVNTADYLVIESTYGTRKHEKIINYPENLAAIIERTLDRGGNLVIPSFAVGRTQELLYYIRIIKEKGLVKGHDHFPVYVDSPLAVEATQIFDKNKYEYFDDDAMELVNQGINPMTFPDLRLSVTSDESKLINFDQIPKVIISASGMCDAGRIRHHLKHNLWRKECTVLFVGFQAQGTLGRILLEGSVDSVKLFGENVEVNAEITSLKGMSGHADKNGLEAMVRQMSPRPDYVFVVHGDDKTSDEFARYLSENFGYNSSAPFSGSVYDLAMKSWVYTADPIPITNKAKARKADDIYYRLNLAADRLKAVIEKNKGMTNKDLTKFTNQIISLCDKWDIS